VPPFRTSPVNLSATETGGRGHRVAFSALREKGPPQIQVAILFHPVECRFTSQGGKDDIFAERMSTWTLTLRATRSVLLLQTETCPLASFRDSLHGVTGVPANRRFLFLPRKIGPGFLRTRSEQILILWFALISTGGPVLVDRRMFLFAAAPPIFSPRVF